MDQDDAQRLAQFVEELVPTSLPNVIRKNQSLVTLRLMTDGEIDGLHAEIVHSSPVKHALDNWRLIVLHDKRGNAPAPLLLGTTAAGGPWVTSIVEAFDPVKSLAVTKSRSTYQLARRGAGEPPTEHLICLCAALHSWGVGDFLGVPPFFY